MYLASVCIRENRQKAKIKAYLTVRVTLLINLQLCMYVCTCNMAFVRKRVIYIYKICSNTNKMPHSKSSIERTSTKGSKEYMLIPREKNNYKLIK